MTAITDLIKLNKHNPSRKMYIKRRLINGNYEADWVRIDNWHARDQVTSWGSISINIDEQPAIIASFEVSGLEMLVNNNDGYFNIENYENSIWYPETTYLNRRYTKLKIDTAYLNSDGEEVGISTDFEGIIDRIIPSEDGTASISCLSYQAIFTKYPITDLALTGSMTASAVITAICNQSKITNYMPYIAPSTGYNYTITDSSLLDGSYWAILQELTFKSNSTIFINGSVFKITPRTAGSVVWNFKGSGSDENADIMNITEYDDEGADKVRVYWKEENGAIYAKSSDATLLLKYLSEPELVNMENIAADNKQGIVNALLTKWESNRPSIVFETKYLLNIITLLDKITLEVRGRAVPSLDGGGFVWGAWTWGNGSVWGKEIGGIIISSGTEWFVTQIIKDFDSWKMTIKAEKVV